MMETFDLNSIIYSEEHDIQSVMNGMNHTAKFTENKGFAIIVNKYGACVGVVTDGDLRNFLVKNESFKTPVAQVVNKEFISVSTNEDTNSILRKFERDILILPVLDEDKKPVGIIKYSQFSILQNSSQWIYRARVPGRISFSGGGTDMSSVFNENPTAVLSSTLNKFCTTSLMIRPDDKIHIYSKNLKLEYQADNLSKIGFGDELDLIKMAILKMKPSMGFNIEISSEIEIGTGLGGSSAAVVSVLSVLNELNNEKKLDDYEIANLAYQVERIDMGFAGGWQDQYATVFGGFNWIEFSSDGVLVHPLRVNEDVLLELDYNLLLFRVGNTRKSAEIHNDINTIQTNDKYFAEMLKNTINMKKSLLRGKVREFGDLLDYSWQLKTKMNSSVTNSFIEELYNSARNIGALGGKLLGAGQSGYLLIYSSPKYHEEIISTFADQCVMPNNFNFNPKGVEIWKTLI